MKFGQKVRRGAQVVTSVCVAGACLAGASSSALARSAALPGITVGLPTGWQVPEGVQLGITTSFAERSTQPRDSQGNNNLAVFLWSTPWKVLGGQLRFLQSFPFNAVSPQEGPWQAGLAQSLTTAQIAWKVADNLGVSYFIGGFWPTDTLFALRSASIAQRFAISYVGDGWNVTANLHYGTMLADNSPTNVHYSDYLNLDLTATKRFGKWSFGAVAFGSTDLPTNRQGYRPLGQVAMGPLVAYAFDTFTVQSFVTRDIAQRNLGGEETRAWLRFLVPLWRPEKADQVPNRVLVRRNSAAGPGGAGE